MGLSLSKMGLRWIQWRGETMPRRAKPMRRQRGSISAGVHEHETRVGNICQAIGHHNQMAFICSCSIKISLIDLHHI